MQWWGPLIDWLVRSQCTFFGAQLNKILLFHGFQGKFMKEALTKAVSSLFTASLIERWSELYAMRALTWDVTSIKYHPNHLDADLQNGWSSSSLNREGILRLTIGPSCGNTRLGLTLKMARKTVLFFPSKITTSPPLTTASPLIIAWL